MIHLLSYGFGTEDRLLEELADESRRYLSLLDELRTLSASERRDDIEGEIYGSISHLAGHGRLLLEHLDGLMDLLPEESEESSV